MCAFGVGVDVVAECRQLAAVVAGAVASVIVPAVAEAELQ